MSDKSKASNRLMAMIGNKQAELKQLYDSRAKHDLIIARAEGELGALRDAQDAVEKVSQQEAEKP